MQRGLAKESCRSCWSSCCRCCFKNGLFCFIWVSCLGVFFLFRKLLLITYLITASKLWLTYWNEKNPGSTLNKPNFGLLILWSCFELLCWHVISWHFWIFVWQQQTVWIGRYLEQLGIDSSSWAKQQVLRHAPLAECQIEAGEVSKGWLWWLPKHKTTHFMDIRIFGLTGCLGQQTLLSGWPFAN